MFNTPYVDGVYERDSNGVEVLYYRFNGDRVAVRRAGTLSYLLSDHLGSTTTALSTSGGVLASQQYYPYGRARSGGVGSYTDKQFTGHQVELSLYFMQARFYDPYVGRFLQPDTLVPDPADPQSLNRYAGACPERSRRVLGNPLRYTDPTGRTYRDALCGESGQCFFLPPFGGGGPTQEAVRQTEERPVPVPLAPCPGGGDYCYEPLGCGIIEIICQAIDSAPRFIAEGTLAFAPVVSDAGDICTFATGRDCASWEKVPAWQRWLSLASVAAPIGFARFADEGADALSAVRRINRLPENAVLVADQKGLERVFNRLQEFHGVSRAEASDRLHRIKQAHGLTGSQNAVVDLTGNVYDPRDGEWIGTLTRR